MAEIKTIRIITETEKQTEELGIRIGRAAEEGLFLALSGDLGAGKTHFVQGVAKGLGITDIVVSPTFTIMNLYEGKSLELKHFDFYRLEEEEELYNIGWDEYGSGGVVAAEWANRFPRLIPEEAVYMNFRTIPGGREITASYGPQAPETVIKEMIRYASGH